MSQASAKPSDGTNIMLAAGGTGGHLFPAFALAEELARRNIIVDLITDMRGDRYGNDFPARKIYRVPAATLAGKNPLAVARTGFTLSRGIKQAFDLFGEVKPRAVVGFGGYPTFPPLIAARLRKIPSALHEQNAVLGRANAMLAKRVSAIATSFENVLRIDGDARAKVRFTGNPVRDVVLANAATPYVQPSPTAVCELLVFGGSQGARYFSDSVPPALASLPADLRTRLAVTQQARDEDVARVEAAYAASGIRAVVSPFFKNLPEIMSKSHLVIGRAGASTVAELTVLGRPSILVPLPHAIDNDQLNNARRLSEAGGCWILEQKDITTERLAAAIHQLFTEPANLATAAANARLQGRPDAVKRLADLVETLVANR